MENGPNADIEATFVEGLSFRIRNIGPKSSQMIVRSDNAEELTLDFHTEELLECKLERLLSAQRQFILSRSRTTVEMLSQHFNIVQTALIECLRIEKTFRNKKNSFPMTVKMIADGTDRSK